MAGAYAAVCFLNLYGFAKERSGPLKPGVESVEGTVKNVVGPVYNKYHDVPAHLLTFVDRKVPNKFHVQLTLLHALMLFGLLCIRSTSIMF